MVTTKKVTGTALSLPKGIALGVMVSLLLTAGMCAIIALMMFKGSVTEYTLGYVSMAVLFISALLGALLSAIRIKRRWMQVCLITGSVYFLILLLCNACLFGGYYQGVALNGILVFSGCISAGLIGLRKDSGSKRKMKKYRTC